MLPEEGAARGRAGGLAGGRSSSAKGTGAEGEVSRGRAGGGSSSFSSAKGTGGGEGLDRARPRDLADGSSSSSSAKVTGSVAERVDDERPPRSSSAIRSSRERGLVE